MFCLDSVHHPASVDSRSPHVTAQVVGSFCSSDHSNPAKRSRIDADALALGHLTKFPTGDLGNAFALQLCGHAAHRICLQRHIQHQGTAFSPQQFARLIYEPSMGEILCPMCRRISSVSIPLAPHPLTVKRPSSSSEEDSDRFRHSESEEMSVSTPPRDPAVGNLDPYSGWKGVTDLSERILKPNVLEAEGETAVSQAMFSIFKKIKLIHTDEGGNQLYSALCSILLGTLVRSTMALQGTEGSSTYEMNMSSSALRLWFRWVQNIPSPHFDESSLRQYHGFWKSVMNPVVDDDDVNDDSDNRHYPIEPSAMLFATAFSREHSPFFSNATVGWIVSVAAQRSLGSSEHLRNCLLILYSMTVFQSYTTAIILERRSNESCQPLQESRLMTVRRLIRTFLTRIFVFNRCCIEGALARVTIPEEFVDLCHVLLLPVIDDCHVQSIGSLVE